MQSDSSPDVIEASQETVQDEGRREEEEDCNGPWPGFPDCQQKMEVSVTVALVQLGYWVREELKYGLDNLSQFFFDPT